jgi:hypothetical protein
MDWLIGFFQSFWTVIKTAFLFILNGAAYILSQIPYLIMDGWLLMVEGFFTLLDLSSIVFATAADWSGLPTQLIWLINYVNLPQGFSIILTGVSIRMLMNLIPSVFTRI